MRITFAAAEVAPYAKVGGLADVAGSLPQALAALGHAVSVYLPFHTSIQAATYGIPASGAVARSVPYGDSHARVEYPEIVREGVRTLFVRSARIGRDKVYGYADDAKRYALFSRAVAIDVAWHEEPTDIVHAHDWHSALLIPIVARTRELQGAATVFTIHNLAYQGRTSAEVLRFAGLPRSRLAYEHRGELNPMARAIAAADIVSTVSERYAEEILTPEFGEGLDELLRERRADLWGITNGIDTAFFDPARDPNIAARYDAENQSGKALDKAALQKELGLTADEATPLFGVVGRLVEQKGVDLLTAVAPELLRQGAQLVVLGTGDPQYEARWRELAAAGAGQLALRLGFDAALAQRIYAGADFFLMPSRFEPCGLGQLISLRYGTIPIVRAVGGLATTVHDVDADPRRGNGFSFTPYLPEAFADAIRRALVRYRADGSAWTALRTRAMREDHSWTGAAQRYVEMYQAAAKARRAA